MSKKFTEEELIMFVEQCREYIKKAQAVLNANKSKLFEFHRQTTMIIM